MAKFAFQGLDGRNSAIEFDRGLSDRLSVSLCHKSTSGLFLVYDPKLEATAQSLQANSPFVATLATSGAESAKNLGEVERLLSWLLHAGADRAAKLVVLGGGAVLDLGALVAGLYMRGIACALLPTSYLAIVDAAVGGKSAIDLAGVKNVAGLFRQPDQVLIDPLWLDSLPDVEFRQGLAELIKMAAILDEEVFHHLEATMDDLKHREAAAVDEAALLAIKMKLEVVQSDEREAGRRALLNFGHTLAHAIETISGYRVAHGEAVAMGMIAELDLLEVEIPRLEALLATAALPTRIPEALRDLDQLWQAMQHDKKNRNGQVQVATPDVLGSGSLKTITRAQLENLR